MHLFVWSNVCWGDSLNNLPPADQLPPKGIEQQIKPDTLKKLITEDNDGNFVTFSDYGDNDSDAPVYETDKARLVEFHRTLPKVRRALANVPTYMIFDDHEISDDWFLNPTWRDRVLGSPLGNAIIRNGMLAYALFQGWGNDPVKFAPAPGELQKQPQEQLLELAVQFMPTGGAIGPDANAARQIEKLLGLDLRNEIALDGSYAETSPPVKWHYMVPGEKHGVLVLDCRTRRSYVSRLSPPGNIGLTAQAEQVPGNRRSKARRSGSLSPHCQSWVLLSSTSYLLRRPFEYLT